MCQPASFVLTKDAVFWSRFTDSHEEIIKESGLHADGAKGPNILRVEVVPPGYDTTRPPAEWVFRVDQDIMPEWYDSERDEARTRAALVDWIAENVISDNRDSVTEGRVFIVGNATVQCVDGNATVQRVHGNATVQYVHGNATVQCVDGNATVHAVYGNATVQDVHGNATVQYVHGNATVTAYGSATVIRWSKTAAVTLSENAVMVDRSGETVVCVTANK
jgi:hypothetical protein